MGWKFYGFAAVYGVGDKEGDCFAPGCFHDFLQHPDRASIPMLNGHDPQQPLGRWLKIEEGGFGLLVIGELFDGIPEFPKPYPGLSVKPVQSKGQPNLSPWGGGLCRWTNIEEISLVPEPSNWSARILGPWT